jgi:Cu/Ag efflux protein CusF
MKTLLVLFAVCLAVGVMASGVYAEAQTKTGTVTKVDVEGKKVTVMVARELTFTVTADTKITQGDKAVTLADIKVGAKVEVAYEKKGEDRVASAIKITAAAEK